MIIFGNGAAYGRQKTDAAGNVLATPNAVRFGIIQDLGFDLSRELKMLYGERAFPVAVGSGKGKADFKAKLGNFSAAMYGQLYAGRTASTTIRQMNTDVPLAITASLTISGIPNSGTFATDYGVTNASTGAAFSRVASAPAIGQYTVSAVGVYAFNAGDVGVAALFNYEYVATVPGTSQFDLSNDVMGLAPTFSYVGQTSYGGKRLVIRLDNCISSKFSVPQKNDDFANQDFEFSAFDNGSNSLGTLMITEPS